MIVWPVSLSILHSKVGSSRFKAASASASFAFSAEVRGSMDILITVCGNVIARQGDGFFRVA